MDQAIIIGYLFSALLGVVVGSFLNVVIYRYNTGRHLRGRSHCLTCSAILPWYDLIPLASFLALRGRCRECQAKISWQYPLIEFITGLVFTLIFYRVGLNIGPLLYYWVIAAVLIAIAGYDLRHKIIPNEMVYLFIGLSLVSSVIINLDYWLFLQIIVSFVHHILSGAIFYYLVWGLWKVSRGRWIGLGDAKLVLGIGLLLGFSEGVTAILVGVWAGAILGLAAIAASQWRQYLPATWRHLRLNLKSEIAFAPFLILGTLATLIFNLNVLPF